MGRFFRQAAPRFVDDTIYTPPWELAAQVIAVADQRNDELVQQSELLKDTAYQVKYLGMDKDYVSGIQQEFESEVDELINAVDTNPTEARRLQPKLRSLSRKLKSEMSTGRLADVQNRYSTVQTWMEENKDRKDSDPDLYNRYFNHFMQDLTGKVQEDPSANFGGQRIVEGIDLTSKENIELLEKYEGEYMRQYTDESGRFIAEGNVKSRADIERLAIQKLLAVKRYPAYARQMHMLGDEGYFNEDENGNLVPVSLMETYSPLSEDGSQMTRTVDGKEVPVGPQQRLNPNHAYYNQISMLGGLLQGTDLKTTSNPYAEIQARGQIQAGLQSQRLNHASQLQAQRLEQDAKNFDIINERLERFHEDDMNFRLAKLEMEKLAKEGNTKAQGKLDKIAFDDTFGEIKVPNVDYSEDLQGYDPDSPQPAGSEAKKKKTRILNASERVIERLGQRSVSPSQRREEYVQKTVPNMKRTGGLTLDGEGIHDEYVQDGTKTVLSTRQLPEDNFTAEAYLRYLRGRRSTPDLVKEYLSKFEWEGKQADNRWAPNTESIGGTYGREYHQPNKENLGTEKQNRAIRIDVDALLEVGQEYNQAMEKEYQDMSGMETMVNFSTMSEEGVASVKSLLNSGVQRDFIVMDARGVELTGNARASAIIALQNESTEVKIGPSAAYSEVMFRQNSNGQEFFWYPDVGSPEAIQKAKSYGTMYTNPKSVASIEFRNELTTRLSNDLASVGPSPATDNPVLPVSNGYTENEEGIRREIPALIEQVGNQIWLYDPDVDLTKPYDYSNPNSNEDDRQPIAVYPDMATYVAVGYGKTIEEIKKARTYDN